MHGGPERQQAHIERLKRNGRHLLEIINDVLDMSRAEAGKLQVQRSAGRSVLRSRRRSTRGRVTISGGTAETTTAADLAGSGPWAYVRVEDTGRGIPAERLTTSCLRSPSGTG